MNFFVEKNFVLCEVQTVKYRCISVFKSWHCVYMTVSWRQNGLLFAVASS